MRKRSIPAVVDVQPVAPVVADPTPPRVDPLILAMADAVGLTVTAWSRDRLAYVVTCGPVPPFTGTLDEVLAAMRSYNCKHCGSGGSHTPNCGRAR
jgi:hypothetical protein